MLIFINGKNEILKQKLLNNLKNNEKVKILEYNNLYDKIFKILRLSKEKDKIIIIKNSLDKDLEYMKMKFNLGYITNENVELFEKYYIYYNKELKMDYNDIKYITVTSRNNLDMSISNINSYIKNHINSHKKTDNNRNKKQKTDYDQAKWLTGC